MVIARRQKSFKTFIIILLMSAVIVTVMLVSQRQDVRQRAQTTGGVCGQCYYSELDTSTTIQCPTGVHYVTGTGCNGFNCQGCSYSSCSTASCNPPQPIPSYGIQIDLSSPGKIPSAAQMQTLFPYWVRFVFHPGTAIPGFPSFVHTLVIFNNESAAPAPIGSTSVATWESYVDSTYIPQLNTFMQSNPAINAIEIWNEEDICPGPSFCPLVPAQAYAYMLQKAVSAIRALNPTVQIVFGGMASGTTTYLSTVENYAPGITSQLSAVGVHPYGVSSTSMGSFIQTFVSASYPAPVWVTEIGEGTTDQQAQATYLTQTFNALQAIPVPVVIWYAWIDTMTGGDGQNDWGLYDSNDNIKPSGTAFASFTRGVPPPTPTPTLILPTPMSYVTASSIAMSYTSKGANKTIKVAITVKDQAGNVVSSAAVYGAITTPSGNINILGGSTGYIATNILGSASYSISLKETGTYKTTVTNIVKSGYGYTTTNTQQTLLVSK